MNNVLYVDLDGVVADFHGYGKKVLGYRPEERGEYKYDRTNWLKLAKDRRLYSKLPVIDGAHNFVFKLKQFCEEKNLDLRFLSAIPSDTQMGWAWWDKSHWVEEYFPGIPLFLGPYSADKWKHCQPGDILIDDRITNINDWTTKAAGYGIRHMNVQLGSGFTGDYEKTLEKLYKWTI